MTANQNLAKIGFSFANTDGELCFPSNWVRNDLINLTIPDEAELVTQSLSQKYPIGTQLRRAGNLYRYSKAGETMGTGRQGFLKCNKLVSPESAAAGGNWLTLLATAGVAGDTTLDLADTNTRAANFYESAIMWIQNDTDKVMDQYTIIASDAGNGTHNYIYIAPPGLKRACGIVSATTGACQIYVNPYSSVGSMLDHATGFFSAIGMAHFPITTAYYFWLHTAGFEFGTGATPDLGGTAYRRDAYSNVDGSIGGYTAGYQRIGYVLPVTTASVFESFIMLQLDQ